MTVAPLPRPRAGFTATTYARQPPSLRKITARRRTVLWTKRLLPAAALLLLSSVALWPEVQRQFDTARVSFRRGGLSADLQAGKLLDVHYHGLDGRNRPYTITAAEARQAGAERVNLVAPKGDVLSENGSWTYIESERGVFMQHIGGLDLSGAVTVFRDDGITMRTTAATVDLKAGAAAGREPTRTEGPFGQLDSSQGFALVDKGAVIQFDGPCHLLLNAAHK